jgi:hypothetical protein
MDKKKLEEASETLKTAAWGIDRIISGKTKPRYVENGVKMCAEEASDALSILREVEEQLKGKT